MHVILQGSGLAARLGTIVLRGNHRWIEIERTTVVEEDCMVLMSGETGHVKKIQAEGRMTIGAETGKRTGGWEGD